MPAYLQNIVDYVQHLPAITKTLVLIFSVATEYVFPIFPGDTVVLLAGFLNAHGAVDLVEVIIAVIIGSLLGAYLGYQIGRIFLKEPYTYSWARRLATSNGFAQFNTWYQKWGTLFLLFNRFFPGIRALFFMAAGAIGLPLFRVLALGTVSAVLFNACLVLLGYWLGFNAERILDYFYRFNAVAYVLIAIAIIAGVYWWRKKHRP